MHACTLILIHHFIVSAAQPETLQLLLYENVAHTVLLQKCCLHNWLHNGVRRGYTLYCIINYGNCT